MAIDPSTLYQASNAPTTNGGTLFLDQYFAFVGDLVETAVLRLTSVAGTDTITASAEPFSVPSTGLVAGMKFTLVPANNNTGAATLNIDARGAESIVSGDGSTLNADELVSGTRYFLEFDGTNFVIIGSQGGTAGAAASRTTYDATAVWANNLSADRLVMVELWGAGGGGHTSTSPGQGGGGGGYARALYKAGDLPSSVTITIPSGGAAGNPGAAGGNATFGSLLTAYGGAGAEVAGSDNGGGGGGGELEAGANETGGSIGGGDGGSGTGDANGGDAKTTNGGGGGGANTGNGGGADFGGGGGAGRTGDGGVSKGGGNGGDSGAAGQRPGGGGGFNAVGGAGRCIITIF